MLEVFRSSRLERLADLLLVKLAATAPQSVLAPQRIVVGHLGMKRWLLRQLAERSLVDGRPGVAANLQLQLPGEWLDELAQGRLGTQQLAIDPYQRASLRWRIFQLLPTLGEAQIEHYLEDEQGPQRQFQLADRLASLYVQYAVYRADWLALWEGRRGGAANISEHWQGELWRQLRQQIGKPHRASRGDALLADLARAPMAGDALHVFGVNHLPPDVLRTLLVLAQHQRVLLYFPDPCRELWEDLRGRAEQLSQAPTDAEFHSEHRLLAGLGKLGQQFTVLLNANAEHIDDRRDEIDSEQELELPPLAPMLQRLQHSIRVLQPHLQAPARGPALADASLRIHACHTRLRELEALRDALLEFLHRHPDAEARDIVVMAPDINLYAPYLAAVFGAPGRHQGPLPYHLADVPLKRSHPLIHAFAELLQLPQQRLGRSQVMALLDLPAVSRRLRLDSSSVDALDRWLGRAEVAWGLDGPMKAEFGAAPVAQNSFGFGLERMLAGYLLGETDPPHVIDAEVFPAQPPMGPDVDALGALDQLLQLLREMRSGMQSERRVSEWADWLGAALVSLFEADHDDPDERTALRAIVAGVEQLRSQADTAQVDPIVPWPVVREALIEVLDGIPARQPFLVGGVTFCGMVPQRAIPFRMVCVLGLNDGEFPRNRSDSGLDLLRIHPRLGDRETRADDRYLFLEALLSARDALHLSYIGEGVQDGKRRNPAAPLSELLQFLSADRPIDSEPAPPWLVPHPLQPFDRRHYDGVDQRLHSYDRQWLAAAKPTPKLEAQDFRSGLPEGAAMPEGEVTLNELSRWYRDPARAFSQNRLSLDLQALDTSADDDREPLEIRLEPLERLTRELVWRALDRGEWQVPQQMPPELAHSGRLPAGALGHRSYALERGIAESTLAHLRSLPPFQVDPAQRQIESVDIALELLPKFKLSGEITRAYRVDQRYYLVELCPGDVNFKQLLPLYIRVAALRLALPQGSAVRGFVVGPGGRDEMPDRFPADPAVLRQGLSRLLLLWYRGQSRPAPYLPKTSWRLTGNKGSLYAAQRALTGGFQSTGELDYAPGYARLLFRDLDLQNAELAEGKLFAKCAESLLQILTNPGPGR